MAVLTDTVGQEGRQLAMLLQPSFGGQAHQVGPRIGQVLQDLDQELDGGEQLFVCLDVRIVRRGELGFQFA
jgi:hypothetical protein